MKAHHTHNRSSGFGVLDLLAIVVIVSIGATLLLPNLGARTKGRASRIQCVSNLKQIALGFRMWANDHQEQFPFAVSVTNGGTLEFGESGEVFRHFLVVSNEIVSPKILACPEDKETRRAISFTNFSNANLSYFLGLDAKEELPQRILAGDRNITGGVIRGSVMVFSNHNTADFTAETHNKAGNLALADGSGSQSTTDMLRRALQAGGLPVRFAIPRLSDGIPANSWRRHLQIIGLWALISVIGVAAIGFYIIVNRSLVARASG